MSDINKLSKIAEEINRQSHKMQKIIDNITNELSTDKIHDHDNFNFAVIILILSLFTGYIFGTYAKSRSLYSAIFLNIFNCLMILSFALFNYIEDGSIFIYLTIFILTTLCFSSLHYCYKFNL